MTTALILVGVVGAYLYFKLDDEIARYAQSFLSDHYQQLDVKIAGARYEHGTGVILSGVALSAPRVERPPEPLLEIAELRLIGSFTKESLSTRKPRIERVEIHRPRLMATRRAGGGWSVQSLVPPPAGDGSPVPIHIYDATIVVSDETQPTAQPLTLQNIELRLNETPTADGGRRLEIRGRAEETLARLIDVQGEADPESGSLNLAVQVQQLGVTTERLMAAPGVPRLWLTGLSVNGQVDSMTTIQRTSLMAPVDWKCNFTLNQGSVAHPLLPKQMTDVEIQGYCDPQGVRIDKATAKSGEAELTGVLQSMGWGPEARATCQLNISRLALNNNVYRILPEGLKRTWNRFEPRGEIDAQATLWLSPGQVWSDLKANGRGLSFTDNRKFPYRVDNGSGTLRYLNDPTHQQRQLIVRLDAQAEGRPVSIQGDFVGVPSPETEAGECPVGILRVSANSLKVTERVLAALPDDVEGAIRKLNPAGEFGVNWSMRRDSLQQDKPRFSMDMLVHDGSLRFEHFPYPVRGVTGRIEQRDDQWRFIDFKTRTGTPGPALAAAGAFDAASTPKRLKMLINGAGLGLDETLRSALSREQRRAWAALRPHGVIGFESSIEYSIGDDKPKLAIKVQPYGDSVSVYPEFFPYRLESVQGVFHFTDDQIKFVKARAIHGQTRFNSDGMFQKMPDNGWRLELADMSIDRLNVNEDFRAAAPVGLRKVINRLEPEGGLSVHHGRLTFQMPSDPGQPLQTTWDLQLDCQQLDVTAGVRIEDLFGMVRITGSGSGDTGASQGEFALESMLWNDMQLTKINGPFYCDSNRCLIGSGAAQYTSAAPRPVVAQAYGGVASVDGFAVFEGRSRYGMQVALEAVDLARFSSDYLHHSANLTGQLEGLVKLQGTGNSIYGLSGSGELRATEAELYELPMLVSVLKVLSNRTPDSTAFDTVTTKFNLRGEYIEFEKLDLEGDAISLYGRGTADLDHNIDLVFHSLMGRNRLVAPLRELFGQASEQILKLKVSGVMEDPKVTREALPLVSNVFQQLQNDLRPQPLTTPASYPSAAAERR